MYQRVRNDKIKREVMKMLNGEKRSQVLGVLCNFGIDWLIESLKSNLSESENFDQLQQAQAAFNGARVIAEVAGLNETITTALINLLSDMEREHWQDSENELKACNANNKHFNKMFLTLMDPQTGEIIVMSGKTINKETGEVSDYAAGNYLDANLIGSTIKGGSLYVGFKNNLITPNTYFMDEPIKIKNTAEKKSWKSFGNINEVDAIAYSSNVYMFRIAMLLGGAEYIYDGPLKINQEAFDTLRRDLGELGLGVKTGLDVPNEALGYRGHNRASGLLLDAMIGQYDAVYIPTDNLLASNMATVAQVTNENNLPVIVGEESMCENGGLATLSLDYYTVGQNAGKQALAILNGEAQVEETPVTFVEGKDI